MSALGVVVLAAGRGTRMKSRLPKVAHPVAGKPMVAHVVDAALALSPARLAVVVGYGAEAVQQALGARPVEYIEQRELLGTGDAVRRCHDALEGCGEILVLNGDSPLIGSALLGELRAARGTAPLAFVTAFVDDLARMGRVHRVADRVAAIVEYAEEPTRTGGGEINAGQYCFDAAWLWAHLPRLPLSASGEYYLTDLVAMAVAEGAQVPTVRGSVDDVLGVDDRVRLAEVEAIARARILRGHMENGVTIRDPATTYIDADVELGEDVLVHPGCHLLGATVVGGGSVIGPNTLLRNSLVGEECTVVASVIEESRLGRRVRVGPFAHVRGNADIGDDVELGNYAEVKNSVLGPRVKMHHFSYAGDADVGEDTNIAAGTITCNFDGVAKHRTTIGKRVFIGSDTMLVAPVTLGDDAFTATGSVVIRDVPAGERVAGVPARPLPRKQPPPS